MILWTIQPVKVYNLVIETGVYRCDPALIHLPEFADSYSWLAKQMTDRIGPAPAGVTFPVWAWYIMEGKRKKPDLRRERWTWGPGNEEYARIEIEVPDKDVLLSDFDAWGSILSNWLLSDTEEEYEQQKAFYTQMSLHEQEKYKEKNWQRVFDITHLDNRWIIRGEWVQATFWELRKEYLRKVWYFRTPSRKTHYTTEDSA